MNPSPIHLIETRLRTKIESLKPLGGGCINECYQIVFKGIRAFCKINSASKFPQLFEKEKHGLELLKKNQIKTPEVIDCFEEEGLQFLILEWIEPGRETDLFWKQSGEQVARMHECRSDVFGLTEDNFMGSVPQLNTQTNTWTDFFLNARLRPMVERCSDQKFLPPETVAKFERLFKHFPLIYEEARPVLVHGDLWNGNVICNNSGNAVFIDPAVYFGHASADIGMTKLFGGFDKTFYESYFYHHPVSKNFQEQCEFSNLYPLLIHLYLFGQSYLPAVERIVDKYV